MLVNLLFSPSDPGRKSVGKWVLLAVFVTSIVAALLIVTVSSDMSRFASEVPSAEMVTAWKHAVIKVDFAGLSMPASKIAKLQGTLAKPVHVLTAWNPGAIKRDAAFNDHATAELRASLEKAKAYYDLEIYPAVGSDQASSWEEHGFAIVGLDRDYIRKLGVQFGQVAFYEFHSDGRAYIIWSVGDLVVEL